MENDNESGMPSEEEWLEEMKARLKILLTETNQEFEKTMVNDDGDKK